MDRSIVELWAESDTAAIIRADGSIRVASLSMDEKELADLDYWKDIVKITGLHDRFLGLKKDGTVISTGDIAIADRDSTGLWTDVKDISATADLLIGLKEDGTIISSQRNRAGVPHDWTDIADVEAGNSYSLGIRADGTVAVAGFGSNGVLDGVEAWTDIKQLATNRSATIGLRNDGTLSATGSGARNMMEAAEWDGIVSIALGTEHIAGLKADGTVVAAGSNNSGQCDVSGWTDITCIAAGKDFTLGLKEDGTVIAAGNAPWIDRLNEDIPVRPRLDVAPLINGKRILSLSADSRTLAMVLEDGTIRIASDEMDDSEIAEIKQWTDLVQANGWGSNFAGLKKDGSVTVVGEQAHPENIADWSNMKQISASVDFLMGLNEDGIAESIGRGNIPAKWTDIVQIDTGYTHALGLRSDGTVIAEGNRDQNDYSDVFNWTDIVQISAGLNCSVGLRSDGTVRVSGDARFHLVEAARWDDIIAVDCGGIIAYPYYMVHIVGLRADGTVVAVGTNDRGQCDVSGWTDIVAVAAGGDFTVGIRADGTVLVAGDAPWLEKWNEDAPASAEASDQSNAAESARSKSADALLLASDPDTYMALREARIGDTVTFGSFEQDGNVQNGKESLAWQVLDRQDDRLLLLSRNPVNTRAFHSKNTAITWPDSNLRAWLNVSFIADAFNMAQRELIQTTVVTADRNVRYNTDPGRDSKDRVFLLSDIEAVSYLRGGTDRQCALYGTESTSAWWLRTPGDHGNYAAYVAENGSINYAGELVHRDGSAGLGVRPAIWIEVVPPLT